MPSPAKATVNWPELVSKMMIAILTLVIIPTFGWVWVAESRISTVESKLLTVNHEVAAARDNSTSIQLIQKDIEHINEKLGEIARLIEKNNHR